MLKNIITFMLHAYPFTRHLRLVFFKRLTVEFTPDRNKVSHLMVKVSVVFSLASTMKFN